MREPCRRQQAFIEFLESDITEWIRRMMNLTSQQPLRHRLRIKNVSLDQKVLEGSWLCLAGGEGAVRGCRFQRRADSSTNVAPGTRCAWPESPALVMGHAISPIVYHLRPEIGEMPIPAGKQHGQRLRRIKAEEPDSRIAPMKMNVRPHIDFAKVRDSRNRGRPPRSHPRHIKRHKSHPGVAFPGVEHDFRREECTYDVGWKSPMHE